MQIRISIIVISSILYGCAFAADGPLDIKLEIVKPSEKERFSTLRLTLTNTAESPVTFHENLRSDDWTRDNVSFVITPQPGEGAVQTCDFAHEKMSFSLESGKNLVFTWKLSKIKLNKLSDYYDQPLFFPAEGEYKIKAELRVNSDFGSLQLQSNEVDFAVGAKRGPPKALTARISESDPKAKTVRLNAGKKQEIQIGDVYWILPTMTEPPWTLKVISTGDDFAICDVAQDAVQPNPTAVFPASGIQAVIGVASK